MYCTWSIVQTYLLPLMVASNDKIYNFMYNIYNNLCRVRSERGVLWQPGQVQLCLQFGGSNFASAYHLLVMSVQLNYGVCYIHMYYY